MRYFKNALKNTGIQHGTKVNRPLSHDKGRFAWKKYKQKT